MSSKGPEIPRSKKVLNVLSIPPFPGSEYPTLSPLTPQLLELYHMFVREENLAALLADDQQTFSKEEINDLVALSRQISDLGYTPRLVSLDEKLDIAEIYESENPSVAAVILTKLLAALDEKSNPAWTARVAAALAYFATTA